MLSATKLLALFLLLPLAAGCKSGGGTKGVSYQDTARANYEKGMAELSDDNFPEAIKYFTFVKSKFPFSAFAKMAELRLADTYFAQEKYVEAIDAYKLFIKFHPTHREATNGYASYRICKAYMEQIPSDWFLVPPAHEKDQGAVKDAMRELQAFLRTFKRSEHLPKVKKLYRKCIRKLADHELYVARFYLERDKPKATILRLETLLSRYPDAGVDPEVMLLLGQTYMKLDQKKKAVATFAKLLRKYPNDANSAKAKLYLRYLAGQRD
jgi:outer membrane protein assembly factor BamD